jgi:hypothetical protein
MQLGIYRHYKGKDYLVLGIARHSETQKLFAVYIPLYDIKENRGIQMTIRPLDMFNEMVETEEGHVKRFTSLGVQDVPA